MNNKHIIIDIRMLNFSGIGTYIDNLTYMIVNSFKEYKFVLLTNPSTDYNAFLKKIKHNNYKILTINSRIYTIREQVEIWSKIPSTYCLYWSPHYNIPILLNKNILITIHDIYHLVNCSPFNFFRKLYSFFMLNIIKYKKCNIITVSEFTKNEILRYTNINENKITVIHNGLETHWKSSNDYINNSSILYVGNMKKHKNVILLIKAFNCINNKSNIKLYLVGNMNNNLDKKIISLIHENQNIILIDYVDKKQLLDYYNLARLFVFPSNYEGFGFTPLEAMACGCPVIATNTTSIPEVCRDAVLYYKKNNLDDLVSKISLLINNKNLCDDFVQKGYKISSEYLWEKTAINTINNLKKLLSL